MKRSDDQEPAAGRSPNVPVSARTYSNTELEAVIRRALEMQAASAARTEDGVSEVDVVRIGQELGLEPALVRRALAEVRTRPSEPQGSLVRMVGGGDVRVSRVLKRPAASVGLLIERYLREAELMVPQRRFPDRTRYVRDSSLVAGLTRMARGFSRTHQPLNLQQLDIAVSALDSDSCLLEISVDLTTMRAGLAGGMLGGAGAASAAWAIVVWATAIVDPLMFIGIPVVAGSWVGMRAIYGTVQKSIQEKLESLLDRVEHNELK
jgi:hypothetical protein